jgi:hypothetical protein
MSPLPFTSAVWSLSFLAASGQQPLHHGGCLFVHLRQEMRVDVQGGCDLAVSQARGYRLDVDATLQQRGSVRMAQIVKPDRRESGTPNLLALRGLPDGPTAWHPWRMGVSCPGMWQRGSRTATSRNRWGRVGLPPRHGTEKRKMSAEMNWAGSA